MIRVERSDLEPVLESATGGALFQAALDGCSTPESIVRTLGRYIQFNSMFGGGVANLAGEVAVRQDLFRDPEEPVAILADRSVEIASRIFFAAVDEFDDRVAPHRDTHRSLAQATLRAAGDFFGFDPVALNRITTPDSAVSRAITSVRHGYGVGRSLNEPDLFRAMGFHLGSELLADDEFNRLDRFMTDRQPELKRHLESARVPIDGTEYPAYFWIRVHTGVEIDHFDAAVEGVNLALRFYPAPDSGKQWLMAGFSDFSEVQRHFMSQLSSGS